jgi:predicted nucleotidyltransferase
MCKLIVGKTNKEKDFKAADIKMNCIQNIINVAPKCRSIHKIVLFGSSIEERCTERSDIDIAIFGSMSEYRFLTSNSYGVFADSLFAYADFLQDYDILYFKEGVKKYDRCDIMRDIMSGEVIYER